MYTHLLHCCQYTSYPVIKLSVDNTVSHVSSCVNFLGIEQLSFAHKLTPQYNISPTTPPCFLWHTFEDGCVPVGNSLDYASALKTKGVSCELHIFSDGTHGLGLSAVNDKVHKHVAQWTDLLMNWLRYKDLI